MSLVDLNAERQRAIDSTFAQESENKGYVSWRGLLETFCASYPLGYIDTLPKFKGKDIVQLGDDKVAELQDTRPYELLDVGCGTGRFLVDCFNRWSNQVKPSGITAYLYKIAFGPDNQPYDISELINLYGIEITRGDAQRLTNYYPENHFDTVTAVHVTRYLADPWAMVREIHKILRPKGIGSIAAFNPQFQRRGDDKLANFLRNEYGWEIDQEGPTWNFAFEKKTDQLDLPIEVDGIGQEELRGSTYAKVFYKLSGI